MYMKDNTVNLYNYLINKIREVSEIGAQKTFDFMKATAYANYACQDPTKMVTQGIALIVWSGILYMSRTSKAIEITDKEAQEAHQILSGLFNEAHYRYQLQTRKIDKNSPTHFTDHYATGVQKLERTLLPTIEEAEELQKKWREANGYLLQLGGVHILTQEHYTFHDLDNMIWDEEKHHNIRLTDNYKAYLVQNKKTNNNG